MTVKLEIPHASRDPWRRWQVFREETRGLWIATEPVGPDSGDYPRQVPFARQDQAISYAVREATKRMAVNQFEEWIDGTSKPGDPTALHVSHFIALMRHWPGDFGSYLSSITPLFSS